MKENLNVPAMRAWFRALRSDSFVQAKGALKVGERYCCLGVACVVTVMLGLVEAVWRMGALNNAQTTYYFLGTDGAMPREVYEALGFANGDPLIRLPSGMRMNSWDPEDPNEEAIEVSFSFLNDDWRLTFSQIADVAEWVYSDDMDPEWRSRGLPRQTIRPFESNERPEQEAA